MITIHLRYTGKEGAARMFAEEMNAGGTAAAIRAEAGKLRRLFLFRCLRLLTKGLHTFEEVRRFLI